MNSSGRSSGSLRRDPDDVDLRGTQTHTKVHVGVGKDAETFMVPTSSYSALSPFFVAALKGNFSGDRPGSITIKEVEPETFNLFVHWANLRNMQFVKLSHLRSPLATMAKLWVFAGFLLLPVLQDEVMNRLWESVTLTSITTSIFTLPEYATITNYNPLIEKSTTQDTTMILAQALEQKNIAAIRDLCDYIKDTGPELHHHLEEFAAQIWGSMAHCQIDYEEDHTPPGNPHRIERHGLSPLEKLKAILGHQAYLAITTGIKAGGYVTFITYLDECMIDRANR